MKTHIEELHHTALVPYSSEQMFALVNDIASYPKFLPWCSGVKILEEHDHETVATIEVSAIGVHKSFTTRNKLIPHKEMRCCVTSRCYCPT